MKNDIKYIVAGIVLAAFSFVGCSNLQEDDFFGESAALRIVKFNKELQARLVEQSSNGKYGWCVQYFVGSDIKGYNLFASFGADGSVKFAGNHPYLRGGNANKYTECVSSYEMLREDGPVLAFNTWNDVLTVFVDPVDPSSAPDKLVDDGVGMSGDNNFVFQGYEGNNILFHGQRHAASIRFVPCDRPWEDYINDVEAFKKRISNSTMNSYYVINKQDTMFFSGLSTGMASYVERLVNPLQVSTYPCLFGLDGFRLKSKLTMGETKSQNFVLSSEGDCLYNEDKSVKVVPTWDYYVNECSSLWRITNESFTEQQSNLYEKMVDEVKKVNDKWVLDSIAIGRRPETVYSETKYFPALVLCIHGPKKMGKTPMYYPYVNMGIYKPSAGVLKFEAWQKSAPANAHMELFAATNLKPLLEQFATSIYGTYNMDVNDAFRPTYVVLNPAEGGNALKLNLKAIVN